jgi:hypothetical protein
MSEGGNEIGRSADLPRALLLFGLLFLGLGLLDEPVDVLLPAAQSHFPNVSGSVISHGRSLHESKYRYPTKDTRKLPNGQTRMTAPAGVRGGGGVDLG